MKLQLITAVLFLSLVSCNEPKQEDNIATSKVELLTSLEDTEDTAKKETVTPEKKEDTPASGNLRTKAPSALLIARGGEPGWYAEFFAGHADFVFDYGKDTVKVDHDFSNIGKDKTYTAKIANVSNDNGKKTSLSLVIAIEDKPCTEANGEKRSKSISVKYNNKEYKGCAEVSK